MVTRERICGVTQQLDKYGKRDDGDAHDDDLYWFSKNHRRLRRAATNEPGDRGRPHQGCMCQKRGRMAARACSGAASRWSHHGVSAIAPVDLGITEVYRWAAPAADVGPTTTRNEPSKSAGR